MQKTSHYVTWVAGIVIVGALLAAAIAVFGDTSKTYDATNDSTDVAVDIDTAAVAATIVEAEIPPEPVVTHIETPETVKAIYMTSWVAATPSLREKVLEVIRTTEVNAVIVDIKDSTGKVAFLVDDPIVNQYEATENRIKNITEFTQSLHDEGIYVIGRISVFQDPHLAPKHPELAIRRKSDGGVWKDRKGLSFLDVKNETVWEYIVALSHASYKVGFDEINFDYIRYPSDGDISDIDYNLAEGEVRSDKLAKFFQHLDQEVRAKGIPTSADVFGMVTTNTDDLGIGQVLEKTLPYFDYVAPMVYPSHYPKGWNGYANPSAQPYDVVYTAMNRARERAEAQGYTAASLRTWIQDFNLGATYTADMVRAQITASTDAGVDSWMIWDPSNTYTVAALLPEPVAAFNAN